MRVFLTLVLTLMLAFVMVPAVQATPDQAISILETVHAPPVQDILPAGTLNAEVNRPTDTATEDADYARLIWQSTIPEADIFWWIRK